MPLEPVRVLDPCQEDPLELERKGLFLPKVIDGGVALYLWLPLWDRVESYRIKFSAD
ncbi:hypothetical protein M413DRAFT_447903, partial [Hebeloma cylindrosporum]